MKRVWDKALIHIIVSENLPIMPSVEEELSEIATDWDVNYLDSEAVGDNRYVIAVVKEDVRLKVYVPEGYPNKYPLFEFDEKEMKDVDEEMQRHILETIHKRISQGIVENPIIKSSLEDIWKQLKCSQVVDNIESHDSYQVKPTASRRKKKKRTKYVMAAQFGILPSLKSGHEVLANQSSPKKETKFAQKPKSSEVEDRAKTKKSKGKAPPMKTARDVINRLKWDDQIVKEEFMIGYEDRFCGIIEAPVFDLNWDDNIASTGPNDKLAIPEHRIQHFKWNDVIVWEKLTRKDFVFGSTDTKTDIVEFIKRWKERQQQEPAEASNNNGQAATEDTATSTEGVVEEILENHVAPNVWNSDTVNKNDMPDELRPNTEAPSFQKVEENNVEQLVDPNSNSEVPSLQEVEEYKEEQSVDTNPLLINHGQEECSFEEIPLPDDTGRPITSTDITDDVLSTTEENLAAAVDRIDVSGKVNFNDTHQACENDWDEMAFGGMWGEVDAEMEQKTTDKNIDFPGMTSCPKEQRQSRHSHRDHPYRNTQNNSKHRHDRDYGNSKNRKNRSKDRQDDHRDKPNGNRRLNDDAQEKSGSQWCIAVDLNGYASQILAKFHSWLFSDRNLWPEPYLFINVGTFSLNSKQDENNFKQAFVKACGTVPDFKASLGSASVMRKSLEAPVFHKSFEHLIEKIKENLEKDNTYFLSCDPHIKFATVPEKAKITRKFQSCNIPIRCLYLWRFGDDNQAPDYINLAPYQRHAGGRNYNDREQGHSSHLEKMIKRDGKLVYNSQWEFTVSKTLSAILRHNSMGFQVDQSGYLEVNNMLQHQFFKRLEVVEKDIEFIVKNNAKKRFTLHGDLGNYKIRANQGHTVDVGELSLQEIKEPECFPTVVHGTNMDAWRIISKTGLNRMRRNHIHMTTALPHGRDQVISGMRNSSNCFIFIDIKRAMEDGMKFYLSENGVILSEGIDGVISPEYFSHVKQRGHNGKDYDVSMKQAQCPKADH